jgi:predicted Zn-dependent protease
MSATQERFDEAMFDFSSGDYDRAISRLKALLAEDPGSFDAQLALGMAYCRKGDYQAAIAEGHKAEKLRPQEQLVHTNLSLFYMKAGNKQAAEHHGAQARMASWRSDLTAGNPKTSIEQGLEMIKPKSAPVKFPDMPWKKK